jgi:hypothetical protein
MARRMVLTGHRLANILCENFGFEILRHNDGNNILRRKPSETQEPVTIVIPRNNNDVPQRTFTYVLQAAGIKRSDIRNALRS